MIIKCYSVRLDCLVSISDRAYKAKAFDGSEALLPKSQVFGQDFDVQKSDAWWISSWILEQKDIQHSNKKSAWFDKDSGRMLPSYTIEKHKPERIEPAKTEPDGSLVR